MLAIRVIPVILYDGQTAIKPVQFRRPARSVGSLLGVVRLYETRQVDELMLLDVAARSAGRGPDVAQVRLVAEELFCPFAAGGGIRGLADATELLRAGADKVVIGGRHVDIIEAVSCALGAQAVVATLDVARGGIEAAVEAARRIAAVAGEILLTSVDREGTRRGYDVGLIRAVAAAVEVPVIAHGGAWHPSDAVAAVEAGASAVAAASMFHFSEWTPRDVQAALAAAGYPVRIAEAAA